MMEMSVTFKQVGAFNSSILVSHIMAAAYVFCLFSFQEYVFRVDPATSLGLGSDCIASYCIGDVIRSQSQEVPELLPCGYLVGDNNIITVNLKGKIMLYFISFLCMCFPP